MGFISGYEWQYALILLSLILLITGFVISRNMLPKRKTHYIQKFAFGAFIPIALIFIFDKPRVSFISKTEFLFQEQKAEKLISLEDFAEYEKDQTRNIQLLKDEVEKLRKELDEVNDYYGNLTATIFGAITVFCLFTIFKKEEDFEENQSNK